MFGDRIFSFLLFSLLCGGATLGSANMPMALAQSPSESPSIAQAETPSPTTPSPKNPSKLKPGDEGDIVMELQNRLKQLGHYEGDATGKYDEKTKEAVAKFQTSQKLEPTGIFDEAAFDKLREIQNIPVPRRSSPPRKRRPSKKALAAIGAGGLVTLLGLGGAIFLLLRYINQGNRQDWQEIEAIDEEEIPESELFSATEPFQDAEAFVKADDHHTVDLAKPFLTVPNSSHTEIPDSWDETAAPSSSFVANSNIPPAIPPRDRPNLPLVKLDPIEELIRELHSPDPDTRKKSIWELAQRSDSRAVQPLVGLLLESDSQQQSLILEALSQIGTRTLKPMNRALALSLQDDNAQVRKNAIRDLTRVYELIAQLSQLIYYATDDPDPEVQETAKWALGQLSHIRMLPSDRNHE
ncbi:peptidoglycan-binding protein [Spirulina sp. 06S082]|uniref:peptidoglycan-binding protein n=1 Tax=Spirulina sp. 06S082 TaxID=3110248 RepID=UPI002B1FA950|nr:peptidoglycan-binding protein [Spirulina sp. 06S082]MEA5467589.1 peptidoglycan-binding protein [Spirulina sp. 06S082]